LGRGVRLADAQRTAQLRVGRDLGVTASRGRRRHGLLAACRTGHRLRRHTSGREANCPRTMERPRVWRHATCRCRLPRSHCVRAEVRARPAERGSPLDYFPEGSPTTTSLIWMTGERSVYFGMSPRISLACGPKPAWKASTESQKMWHIAM